MKNFTMTLIAAATLTACVDSPPKPAEPASSPMRPGEELTVGAEYTDDCEFVAWNDLGDELVIYVRKGDEFLGLINCLDYEPDLHRGDRLRLVWEMDTLFRDGPDGNDAFVTEFALRLADVKPGPLSKYLKREHPMHDYWGPDEWTEEYQKECMEAVDYFIATTTLPVIRDVVDENREAVLPIRLGAYKGAPGEMENPPSFVAIIREGPGEEARILVDLGVRIAGAGEAGYCIWHEGEECYVPIQ